jgi:hypothetical protein
MCHPFADFITQFHLHHGKKATPKIIKVAWKTFNWQEPSVKDIL